MSSASFNYSVNNSYKNFESFLKEHMAEDLKFMDALSAVPDTANRSKRVELILNREMRKLIANFCNSVEATKLCSFAARLAAADESPCSKAKAIASGSNAVAVSAAASWTDASAVHSASSSTSASTATTRSEDSDGEDVPPIDDEDLLFNMGSVGKQDKT